MLKFQFPSNGKVYSKTKNKRKGTLNNKSFNSLQTGKCIARKEVIMTNILRLVSIPFKRESV